MTKRPKPAARRWISIASSSDIPLREGRAVQIGAREIAVFNLGERFLAIENRCPHNGGPLCDGIVSGASVVCPLHGWKVDLESGAIARPEVPVCVETYRACLEGGFVFLEVPGEILPALEPRGLAAHIVKTDSRAAIEESEGAAA